jgi:hypothetical protein
MYYSVALLSSGLPNLPLEANGLVVQAVPQRVRSINNPVIPPPTHSQGPGASSLDIDGMAGDD